MPHVIKLADVGLRGRSCGLDLLPPLALQGLDDLALDPGAGVEVRLDGLADADVGQGHTVPEGVDVTGTEEPVAVLLAHVVDGGGELVLGGLLGDPPLVT